MITGRFICPGCNQQYKDLDRLKVHRISFLPELQEICKICEKTIPSCVTKEVHIQSHPICSNCDKCFLTRDKYLLHVMTSHPETVPRNLTTHAGYGVVTCFICGWAFKETALADIHVRAFHPIFLVIFKKFNIG